MKTKCAAVIGCGKIAKDAHIPALIKNPGITIKYLVDIIEEKAVEIAGKHLIPNAITDYRDILADKDLEIAFVCTPNNTHAPISIDLLNAGINVLCEKPASTDYSLTKKMKEAADQNNRLLSIGVVNRFSNTVNIIKNYIETGKLGTIYQVNCTFRSHRAIPGLGGQFTTKAISGGGVLIDWGVHFIDIINYCLPYLELLSASGSTSGLLGKNISDYAYIDMWAGPPVHDGIYDVEDYITGHIRTSGPSICINGAWAQNLSKNDMSIEFLGDTGGIRLQYGSGFTFYTYNKGVLYETTPSYKSNDMFYDQDDDFIRSCDKSIKNRSNIDNILISAKIIDMLYESARLNKEVFI